MAGYQRIQCPECRAFHRFAGQDVSSFLTNRYVLENIKTQEEMGKMAVAMGQMAEDVTQTLAQVEAEKDEEQRRLKEARMAEFDHNIEENQPEVVSTPETIAEGQPRNEQNESTLGDIMVAQEAIERETRNRLAELELPDEPDTNFPDTILAETIAQIEAVRIVEEQGGGGSQETTRVVEAEARGEQPQVKENCCDFDRTFLMCP